MIIYRILVSFVAVVLLSVSSVPILAQATSAADCSGYTDYNRYLVEDQAWWTTMLGQTGDDFGHIHMSTCFPLGQVVKGIVPLDITLTMHENPGKLTSLTIQIGGSGQYVAARKVFNPAMICAGTCTWLLHLDMDTRGFANDGSQEVRIRPKVVEPSKIFDSGGDELVGSSSLQVWLANGKPISSYRDLLKYIQMKAWYSGVKYAQARITDGYPYSKVVRGIWTIKMACDASDKPVTGCLATFDPDFHNHNDGIVQLRRSRPFNGTLSMDTRQLSNGWHKFAIRTDVDAVRTDSTLSAVMVLWVNVKN